MASSQGDSIVKGAADAIKEAVKDSSSNDTNSETLMASLLVFFSNPVNIGLTLLCAYLFYKLFKSNSSDSGMFISIMQHRVIFSCGPVMSLQTSMMQSRNERGDFDITPFGGYISFLEKSKIFNLYHCAKSVKNWGMHRRGTASLLDSNSHGHLSWTLWMRIIDEHLIQAHMIVF